MEVRVLAPSGVLGAGFKEASFARGVSLAPHVIACDGGSTDSGPAYLGGGKPKLARAALRRDLRLMMQAGAQLGVPVIVGSCGTSGRDTGVALMAELAREIAEEGAIRFRMALIRADQDTATLTTRLKQGRIRPLSNAPRVDADVLANSHVVGMMGTEPIKAAIEAGATLVLAGRASDSALYAAVPEMLGADRGLAWHAAKTIECGAACCVVPAADGLMATIRDDHFDIEPLDPGARVTPVSVAAHTLYENGNPYLLTEPSGTIDTEHATYEALDNRSVRVRGSRFLPAETYTIKLEGARHAGYQTIAIGGIRDPYIIRALDGLLPLAQANFRARVAELYGDVLGPDDYDIGFRIYGRDAVMGVLEPHPTLDPIPKEVGILISVTAPTQELATNIASFVSHRSAHLPIPEYHGLVSSIAYPFSPPEIERGAVYRFTLNHVAVPDSPLEMFRTEMVEI